ncbi:helix-turn-helix domain-containing protein [Streptomyces sp. NPDC051211]|uniref:GbsR/MarR family transcriptional regulator n=1 Tax=Streptomyces sp. NPDC051211 TaxID=3154643 RepID=UPI003450DCCB
MPGGRLTPQDRRQIAAGLAEDLSYTEIAKRLDRPTSTVTREVMRNGGPTGYHADRAQQAAVRRARRDTKVRAPESPEATASASARDPETVHAFTDRFTELLVATGLQRMTAGVLGCLYATDSGSLTAAELAERLRVSPASVSKAVGYLEAQELIRRERDARRRRDRYVIDEDVWFRAVIASARINTVLADAAREGAGLLGADTPAGTRLEDMGRFLGAVGQDLIEAAEHRRRPYAAQRTQRSTDPAE